MAMDDVVQPKIHVITFTSEGKLSRIKTSTSPVKVEILEKEEDLHDTSVCSRTGPAAPSSGAARQLGDATDTSPQLDSNAMSKHDSETSPSNFQVRTISLNGQEVITMPDLQDAVRRIWNSYPGSIQRRMPKLGINVKRFSSEELITLKQQGAIGLSVKCCSYISMSDFDIIAKDSDITHATHHRENLLFLPHVSQANPQAEQRISSGSPSSGSSISRQSSTVFTLHPILQGKAGKRYICTDELQKLLETHFRNSEILNLSLHSLGIFPCGFTCQNMRHSARSSVSESDSGSSYVLVEDAERIISYAADLLRMEPPDIRTESPKPLKRRDDFVGGSQGSHSIGLEVDQESSDSRTSNSTLSSVNKPGDSGTGHSGPSASCSGIAQPSHVISACEVSSLGSCSASQRAERNCGPTLLTDESERHPSSPGVEIRTFLLDGQIIVCIPDVHRVVIQLYSQSVQVSSYMRQLQITPQRFSGALLKQLKAHNALSARATVCTYITKPDAERLLSLYGLSNTGSILPKICWRKPIHLDNLAIYKEGTGSQQDEETPAEEHIAQSPTVVPTFEVNGEVFVSIPDAHKLVQVINGQSLQLRYNLDELGITKHKFPHTNDCQGKACSILNVCTFITKRDAERLVQFYLYHKNVSRFASIQWLPAIKLGSCVHGGGVSKESGDSDAVSSAVAPRTSDNPGSDVTNLSAHSEDVATSPSHNTECEVNDTEANSEISIQPDATMLHGPHRREETTQVSPETSNQCSHHCSFCCSQQQNSVAAPSVPRLARSVCSLVGVGVEQFCYSNAPSAVNAMSSSGTCANRSSTDSVPVGSPTTVSQRNDQGQRYSNGSSTREKRARSGTDEERNSADAKRLREENKELLKTLQRKETELQLLYDAYQHHIHEEHERRKVAERKLDELQSQWQRFPGRDAKELDQ